MGDLCGSQAPHVEPYFFLRMLTEEEKERKHFQEVAMNFQNYKRFVMKEIGMRFSYLDAITGIVCIKEVPTQMFIA